MRIDENIIADLALRGITTDTFRRLDPAKKEKIYRTAISLFGEYGYDGMAIDRLCDEAGISKGSFFQYFPSKTHLLEFTILVFDDYLERWTAEIRKNETAVLARDRLLYLFQSLVLNTKLFPDEQKFFLFIANALHHAGVAIGDFDVERHFHSYISEIIKRAGETGEVREDYDPELSAHLVSLIIGALIGRQFKGRKFTRSEMEEYLISFLFDGIKA